MGGGALGHIDLEDPQLWESFVVSHWVGAGLGALSRVVSLWVVSVFPWLVLVLSSVSLGEWRCRWADSIHRMV